MMKYMVMETTNARDIDGGIESAADDGWTLVGPVQVAADEIGTVYVATLQREDEDDS